MTTSRQEAFRGIPFDVKDHILSLIASPRDLLALSLTSHEWSAMILPVHIRYRELRVRGNQSELWQHLSTTRNLSKNIRKVCLMRPDDHREERLPLVLNKVKVPTRSVEEIVDPRPEMIQALSHFESLTSFTWLGPDQDSQFTESLFGALANCHGLDELILDSVPRKEHFNPESSIWRIRNLRVLLLTGLDWGSLGGLEDCFVSMLNNSPALEELSILYDYSSVKFTSCRFPSLTKLRLSAAPNHFYSFFSNEVFLSINNPIIDFLLAHPTIQALSWYPVGQLPDSIPQGLLPNLKHLYTHYRLSAALLRDDTVINSRILETISELPLNRNTMELFESINGSRLQHIQLYRTDERYHGIEAIQMLALLAPTIKTLGFVGRSIFVNPNTLDEHIDCFGEFPSLENLYNGIIWQGIHDATTEEEKEDIIRKLYTRCSALKTLRAVMGLKQEIVFFRDGLADVTWKLQAVKNS